MEGRGCPEVLGATSSWGRERGGEPPDGQDCGGCSLTQQLLEENSHDQRTGVSAVWRARSQAESREEGGVSRTWLFEVAEGERDLWVW